MKKRKLFIFIFLIIVGFSLLSYPTISNQVARYNQNKIIRKYEEQTKKSEKSIIERHFKNAKEYNDQLSGKDIVDPFVAGSGSVLPSNYNEILYFDRGVMGTISIPVIDVSMPIFHGVSESAMRNGAGHLKETSFPIGGEGNHSVLSSHRGLTSAKLFTDLDKVKKGDEFYITILGKVKAYKVDQIKVVEPKNTSDLLPVKGKDYITLLTCTPYSINSHRLLVRGHRIPYVKKQEVTSDNFELIAILILMFLVLVLILKTLYLYKRENTRRRKSFYFKRCMK